MLHICNYVIAAATICLCRVKVLMHYCCSVDTLLVGSQCICCCEIDIWDPVEGWYCWGCFALFSDSSLGWAVWRVYLSGEEVGTGKWWSDWLCYWPQSRSRLCCLVGVVADFSGEDVGTEKSWSHWEGTNWPPSRLCYLVCCGWLRRRWMFVRWDWICTCWVLWPDQGNSILVYSHHVAQSCATNSQGPQFHQLHKDFTSEVFHIIIYKYRWYCVVSVISVKQHNWPLVLS